MAKRLSYIEDARCLKVNLVLSEAWQHYSGHYFCIRIELFLYDTVESLLPQ